jgi:hypothetical protein
MIGVFYFIHCFFSTRGKACTYLEGLAGSAPESKNGRLYQIKFSIVSSTLCHYATASASRPNAPLQA